MSEPLLSINALDAHYGDFQALYGIDIMALEEALEHRAREQTREER